VKAFSRPFQIKNIEEKGLISYLNKTRSKKLKRKKSARNNYKNRVKRSKLLLLTEF